MGMADVGDGHASPSSSKFDPTDPHWPDRDRSSSAAHGSMCSTSLLSTSLATPAMTLYVLKRFRQIGS
jgi:transketolase